MQILTPESDGSSKDILAENIAKLKELFPEVFAEGKIDFDALKQLLGEHVETADERYNFTWNGKSKARWLAQTRSMGTLRPCPEESVNWDTTQNLFIEGDNLEVLKQLQKSYYKKIKMIYIDPPYNTGNDFIYPDNFRDSIKTYLELTGQTDGGGRRLSTNPETSGRFHTDWLNMMYPRLKLARNLLRDDGVIFISIDDNEVANLRKICDEIFGEECFLVAFVWHSKKGGGGDVATVVGEHEYILTYARTDSEAAVGKQIADSAPLDLADERGPYRKGRELNKWGAGSARTDRPTMFFPIPGPKGAQVFPIRNDGAEGRWRLGMPAMINLVAAGNALFEERPDGTFVVYEKIRTNEPKEKSYRSILKEAGTSAEGTAVLKALFGGRSPFAFPKPPRLVELISEVGAVEEDDIVLDFFSGSCTTAHATLELNKKEGGNRKFIMVQLPQPLDPEDPDQKVAYDFCIATGLKPNIAEIGKERIRRVIKKLNDEDATTTARETQSPALFSPAGADEAAAPRAPDRGFKVFKLDSSNIKTWDPNFNQLEHTLLSATEKMKPDRTEADVIYEVLLKYGLDLTLPIEKRTIADRTVYIIGGGSLVVCLGMNMTLKIVEKIAELKDEFKPESPPGMRMVFKDNGFAGDELKTNAVQILKQRGIEDVRAL